MFTIALEKDKQEKETFTIVLVDDLRSNRLLMEKALQKIYPQLGSLKLEIISFSTFDEARNYFENTTKYDLVILDGNLDPSISGDRRKSFTLFDMNQNIDFTNNPEPKVRDDSTKKSGVELAQLVRERTPDIPIIPWTNDEVKKSEFCNVLGANTPCLAKPFSLHSLKEVLKSCTSSPHPKRRHTISLDSPPLSSLTPH